MAASPQLLIIDSVLMSALLGRRAPGTAVILTVPPIVKPLPPCWWHRWSKESQVPIVTERWGDVVGWETFSDRLLSREISGGQQASSALLGITTTANLDQPGNQLDLEKGCRET